MDVLRCLGGRVRCTLLSVCREQKVMAVYLLWYWLDVIMLAKVRWLCWTAPWTSKCTDVCSNKVSYPGQEPPLSCFNNPLHAKMFRGNIHIFTFYVISRHWYDAGSWNPFSSKTRTNLFYIVNIMAADVLATQGARASATMILTKLNRDNSVPAR